MVEIQEQNKQTGSLPHLREHTETAAANSATATPPATAAPGQLERDADVIGLRKAATQLLQQALKSRK